MACFDADRNFTVVIRSQRTPSAPTQSGWKSGACYALTVSPLRRVNCRLASRTEMEIEHTLARSQDWHLRFVTSLSIKGPSRASLSLCWRQVGLCVAGRYHQESAYRGSG